MVVSFRGIVSVHKCDYLQPCLIFSQTVTLEVEDAKASTGVANLAELLLSQGRLKEAEELFLQAIDTNKRALGWGWSILLH